MKIIFMGTPDFAVPCLKKLIDSHNVCAVFSQPDKPVGRKQIMTPPPVKKFAQENNIEVFQPETLKNAELTDKIKELNADVIIVVAYGKILPKEILTASKYGCINVHASLLPKYRGAAPIQWAVLNGDSETGVTIMQMDEGLDTGDILLVKKTAINPNDTSEDMFERLSVLGADALTECLDMIEKGTVVNQKQPEGNFGYAEKITKKLSPVDWSKSAQEIHNQIRGLYSWPCASTQINGKNVKIYKSVISDETGNKPGLVVDNNNDITVSCGDNKCIKITELQADGKKRMSAKAFLQGNKVETGTVLGE